jgi:hypothetical protein
MSFLLANPAGFSHLFPHLVERADKSVQGVQRRWRIAPYLGRHLRSNWAAIAANFRSQCTDEHLALVRVCRYVIPPLFGHRFGAFHAPCGSSLFCFGFAALRVTVSLQILFGKYTEKISQDPP